MSRGVARALACLSAATCVAACNRAAPPEALAPHEPATQKPPASAPQAPPAQAVVTARRGQVELQRGAAGQWSEVQVGDRLSASDTLRTEVGEADLAVEGVKLRLHEGSGVLLRTVDARAVRAQIRGSVESEVEEKKGKLDVETFGSDALAHSEGGHFYVNSDGRGIVAVAAVDGSVHLSSAGRSVEIRKGEVSRVGTASSAGPDAPVAALRRVLLSVEWPTESETNRSRVPISGKVEAGSRVFVQGQAVAVEPSGSFRAEVPLKQGKQKIAVFAIDALGRRRQVETMVARDDSLPDVQVKKKLWQWH
jgi:hypothetical protein